MHVHQALLDLGVNGVGLRMRHRRPLSAEPVPSAGRRRRPPCAGSPHPQYAFLTRRPLLPPQLFGYLSQRRYARPSPALRFDADAEALAPTPHSSRTDGQILKEAQPPARHPHHISCTRASSSAASAAVQHSNAARGVLIPSTLSPHTHFQPPNVLHLIRANSATALGPRLRRCFNISPPFADADPARASTHTVIWCCHRPYYRASRPPVPLRLDPRPATRSHGECGFLGGPHAVLFALQQARIEVIYAFSNEGSSSRISSPRYAVLAAFVKLKLCADTLRRQLSAARSKSKFAVLYLKWARFDFFGWISLAIEDVQVLQIHLESNVFLLRPELGNLEVSR
ncbi:hypothetical protein B0H13DRAFT_1911445 [Mycena leptocephala]|nr:hypothetical protein B0H13DRAFT_1911445 [Mycena leptocephala]